MPDSQTLSDPGRDKLAGQVVFWSGIGIAIISVSVVFAASFATNVDKPTLTTVFNTLIPLFGTWVGTVLAFYFSGKNYEAAAKATRELVGQLGDERLKQIPVTDAWIPVGSIKAVTVAAGNEATVNVQTDLVPMLTGVVTRIPVWNAGKVVRYVIHQSMIYRYLATLPAGQTPTLDNFLAFHVNGGAGDTMRGVVDKIARVARTATLADAKAKMESVPNCQDVFVTETGADTEPVLGWITNVDIAKKAKA